LASYENEEEALDILLYQAVRKPVVTKPTVTAPRVIVRREPVPWWHYALVAGLGFIGGALVFTTLGRRLIKIPIHEARALIEKAVAKGEAAVGL
jgi:hypothetical protein